MMKIIHSFLRRHVATSSTTQTAIAGPSEASKGREHLQTLPSKREHAGAERSLLEDVGIDLSVEGISLSFKGIKAIRNVHFKVMKGEVFALIGPNGAGKSSMLNVVNGIYKPDAGSVRFQGHLLTGMASRKIVKLGVARTFQNIEVTQDMSTLDKVLTGCTLQIHSNFWEQMLYYGRAKREEAVIRKSAEEIIEFLQIQSIRNEPVNRLSYGLQKRVELGKALVSHPKLLLMDEPMAGMNLEEKRDISFFIKNVNEELGTTVVLIEHDMGVVMDISDHVVVMDYGEKIGDGTPSEIQNNERVIQAYLGK